MITYVKIDRATGDVVSRMTIDAGLEYRGLDKIFPWLEVEQKAPPVFDPETHKLEKTVSQPDLSDLSVDVPATARRVLGWKKVALNAGELAAVKYGKIDRLHHGLMRVIEDLAESLVTGAPLDPKALAKINTIRRLRGKADL